ncbi:MAG: RluA family pseudouridine synthase [Pseudomonadota bacterium]
MEIVVSSPGRADAVIAAAADDLSRTRVKGLIRAGAVELNGEPLTDPAQKLAAGDRIRLTPPPPEPAKPAPEPIPLDILYEDDSLIVLVKPAGMVVHPAAGHFSGTLVNALLHHCGDSLSGIGGVARPGIVHRLDKDTSGVMVVAKTDAAHAHLSAQFADHGRTGPLLRLYDALVWGAPEPPAGTIDAALGRHPTDRQRFAVRADGKVAITHFALEERLGAASRLSLRLETGRTHQIRVHMTHKGHPLLGDATYGTGFATKANHLSPEARAALAALGRQALHAAHLSFAHPATGAHLSFNAPLPKDLSRLHCCLTSGA